MKKAVLFIALVVLGSLTPGCTKYLDQPTPKGTVTETSQDQQVEPYRPDTGQHR